MGEVEEVLKDVFIFISLWNKAAQIVFSSLACG